MSTIVSVTISMHNLPIPVIDDEIISTWIEGRLNETRNTFIRKVSRGGGRGRVYGNHRASRPGEYPATDTGRLVNSVDFQMNGPREGVLDSNLIYAGYLTTGTRYMEPRKMLAEALAETLRTRPDKKTLMKAAYFKPGGSSLLGGAVPGGK